LLDWEIAEAFGWTFEYIQTLPMSRIHEYIQIKDARAKAAQKPSRKR